MKKAAALLLVLAMVFSLCACGKSELVGTWQGRLDMTEQVRQEVDQTMAQMESLVSGDRELPQMSDYLDNIILTYTIAFNEDGTYISEVDQAGIDAMAETMKVGLADYVRQLFFVLLCETLEQMGVTQELNSVEELETFLGISMDEAISESLGMTLDEYMDMMVDEGFQESIASEGLSGVGNFKNKDGKLYMSDGLDYQVDPAYYETYELDGDTLTINVGTATVEGNESFYPLVLHKVA